MTASTQQIANNVRRRVLEHVLRNNGGYMSQACSAAEMFAALYTRLLKIGPSEAPMIPPPFGEVPGDSNDSYISGGGYNGPRGPEFDRLIFSPAHYALVLYTTLIETGRLAPEALDQFNADGSTVEMIGAEHSPGMETTTGSLAQAISQAGGIALARKLRGDTGRVWVVMSDGEFQEGQTWEALAAIRHYALDNMAIIVDVNAHQCDGKMSDVMEIAPIADRVRAFGAAVHDIDGHDIEAMVAAANEPRGDGRALVILCNTDPCRGLDVLRSRAPALHYLRFKSAEERATYEAAYAEMCEAHGAEPCADVLAAAH